MQCSKCHVGVLKLADVSRLVICDNVDCFCVFRVTHLRGNLVYQKNSTSRMQMQFKTSDQRRAVTSLYKDYQKS